jgi:hypothetical protein
MPDRKALPHARWEIYRAAGKAIWIGSVEANDQRAALETAAKEFKTPATRLIAVRRS